MQCSAVLAVVAKHLLSVEDGDGALQLALPHPRSVALGLTVQADVGLADHVMADGASQDQWLAHWHFLELVG